MATSSQSSTGWRLFGVLCFVLLLSMAYNSYQHYLNQRLVGRVEYVTNNYKTVRDSVRHVVAVRPLVLPAPTVVYRQLPASAAQLAALRQALTLDVSQQLRRELARQAPRPVAGSRSPVRPAVVALKDSVVLTRPRGGQLTASLVKTGTFSDKWLSLTGVVKPGQAGRPDSLAVKYQVRNEFDVQAYSHRDARHWWQVWAPRRVYVRLHSRNPNATTAHLDSVRVRKR